MLSKKNINLFPTNSQTEKKQEIKKWLEFFRGVDMNKYFSATHATKFSIFTLF